MSTSKIYSPDEPPVPRKRRGFLVPLLFFALGALTALGYSHWYAGRNAGEMKTASSETAKQPKILYYVDPMNPSNKSDKPGKAPCGMDLVPIYEDEQSSAPVKKQPKILYYADPMNPSNKSDNLSSARKIEVQGGDCLKRPFFPSPPIWPSRYFPKATRRLRWIANCVTTSRRECGWYGTSSPRPEPHRHSRA